MTQQLFRSTWPLFFGIGLLMLGNGLQGTLLGWRASLEDFSTLTTGLIMTGYYVGFMLGSTLTSVSIREVGHIRVFAALASMASTAILVQSVFVEPWVWVLMRLVTGFCYAGLYIVCESWLNNQATNETRGRLFSIYMVITFVSMGGGQWLMKLSDPGGSTLFILVSLLISIALVPLLLTKSSAPTFEDSEHLSLVSLFKISPLGVTGMFATGIAHSALFAMGAVYAAEKGLSVTQTALFMSMAIFGGVLLQWPIGTLSDKFDRRMVMMLVSFGAAAVCAYALNVTSASDELFILFGLFGGLTLPLYSLAVAQTNDRLNPEQMVAASSGLVMVTGLGSCTGPITVGWLMSTFGSTSYFAYLAGIHAFIGVFAIIMIFVREAAKEEDQVSFRFLTPRVSVVAAEAVAQTVEEEWEEQHQEDNDTKPAPKEI